MTAILDEDSHDGLLGPLDDGFHEPDDHPWFHETQWFSFLSPEHRLGGWLYNWVRPNRGISGGGLMVWDDSAFFHMEVPYHTVFSNLHPPLVHGEGDVEWGSRTRVRVVEPLTTYDLTYRDRDLAALEVRFEATMPPWVERLEGEPPHIQHFDQIGRVTGGLTLRGTRIELDCLAMRDRSWSPRSEIWKDGHVGYTTAAGPDISFLVRSAAGTRGTATEQVNGGFVQRDGRRARIVSGTRHLERDPVDGFLRTITVEVVDTAGRTTRAVGEGVSRMAMPIPGVHGVSWTSLVLWTIDGSPVWGDDQDAWALHEWRAFRRQGKAF